MNRTHHQPVDSDLLVDPAEYVRPCTTTDPDVFQPKDTRDLMTAKSACARCLVSAQCLLDGIAQRESGVYGGVLLREGRLGRTRGRPVKTDHVDDDGLDNEEAAAA